MTYHTTVTLRTTYESSPTPLISETVVTGGNAETAAHLILLAADHLIGRGIGQHQEDWFLVQILNDVLCRSTPFMHCFP